MKKNELVDMMVEETGMTKTAVQKMLGALTDAVTKSLSGGKKGERAKDLMIRRTRPGG